MLFLLLYIDENANNTDLISFNRTGAFTIISLDCIGLQWIPIFKSFSSTKFLDIKEHFI